MGSMTNNQLMVIVAEYVYLRSHTQTLRCIYAKKRAVVFHLYTIHAYSFNGDLILLDGHTGELTLLIWATSPRLPLPPLLLYCRSVGV